MKKCKICKGLGVIQDMVQKDNVIDCPVCRPEITKEDEEDTEEFRLQEEEREREDIANYWETPGSDWNI